MLSLVLTVAVAACPVQVANDSLKNRSSTLLTAQGEVIAVIPQRVSVECSADRLRLVGGAKWPAPMSFKVQTPLRLELEVPQPDADVAGWFHWSFDAERMERNEAVVVFPPSFAVAKAAVEKRWADAQQTQREKSKPFVFGTPTKVGLVDEEAPDDSIYWSGNTLCIGQGDSSGKQVRCVAPTTGKWSARVAKTSRPNSVPTHAASLDACAVSIGADRWPIADLGMPLESLPDDEVEASRRDNAERSGSCGNCASFCPPECEAYQRERHASVFLCPTTLRRSPDGKFVAFTATVERTSTVCTPARCFESAEKLRRVLFLAPIQAR